MSRQLNATPGSPPKAIKSRGGLYLSEFLRALDGVLSQEGRVLIMTTNHMARLDPALLRLGRAGIKALLPSAEEDVISQPLRQEYVCLYCHCFI
ncbi:uncharacterized protein TRIVIDRAFT_53464 [Trichoderma virens Gv29-8]|uniref:ATPase AAA-type core domain-containing protein n=1 Tax=Hypocrea virens (strain Gv29-8 / FGSC 10586) TaxID=413071 RepID=G9MWG2_HYPVG|nr:uncharacterized protein TRIVIDRAFT_53464 [Trichoderma virens Gv29-8]EHK21134.1 hypothetical protein TRIVIDRAFT_53464 [Trichoderma virens Gv29-8]